MPRIATKVPVAGGVASDSTLSHNTVQDMKRQIVTACAIVLGGVLLASCASQPTTPAVPTAEENFSKGLWSLATRNRPIELADVSQALDLKSDDYEDSPPVTNAWGHGLLLKKDRRDMPGQDMVRVVNLSKVKGHGPYFPASKKPAKPITQVVEIVLQAPFCVDGEVVAKQVGVESKREFHPGFADVTPATFTVISHENDHAEGKILTDVGCTGFVTVQLAFEE
jgi:hypothetical protein